MSREPIILLGTHRSGTTWLGDVFSQHPDLAYWVEPRHIWTWGNAYQPDDVLTEEDATQRVCEHVRESFARYVSRQGRLRLCEKTPSNCLRLRFIREIYPGAKMIMIIRDGRSVLRSTDAIMTGGVPMHRILRRARQTPLKEWPAYTHQAIVAVRRKVTGRKLDYWGPRPPGWRDWLANDPTDVMIAKQWVGTITRALDDAEVLAEAGRESMLTFRFEEFVQDPGRKLAELCEYLELARPEPIIEYAESTAESAKAYSWRELVDEETLELVKPHLKPTLDRLGYEW